MRSVEAQLMASLSQYFNDPEIIEMRMVRPKEIILDRRGVGKEVVVDATLTLANIKSVCQSLANARGLTFDVESRPKISCILEEGHRFECAIGQSVRSGLSMAIRCKHDYTPSWSAFGIDEDVQAYMEQLVMGEKNLIISGATNTGKTTLLNMLLNLLPADRRVIGIEDTPELDLKKFWDGVGLVASREVDDGGTMLDWRGLYDHCMRATPDHIVFGEISTTNAFAALGCLNSGVTGFMCTIHAESPLQVLNRKFDQNIAWAGQTMNNVSDYLNDLVDVVVQIKRTHDGYRCVTDIYEPRNKAWVLKEGTLCTS